MKMKATHCWQGRKEYIEERFGYLSEEHIATYLDDFKDGTCMLMDGHDGPHEFTPDSEITIQFVEPI